jgi:hypothetical protein
VKLWFSLLVQHYQFAVDCNVGQLPKVRCDFRKEPEQFVTAAPEHAGAPAVFDE